MPSARPSSFWRVEPENSEKFKFYDFVRHYHERDAAHCPELSPLRNEAVTAVLDGQQRLTALNIGLGGSMAIKLPYKWRNNPDAFPRKVLHLNLLSDPIADEDGVIYRFRFLDPDQVENGPCIHWFPVPDILSLESGPDMLGMLQQEGLSGDDLNRAFRALDRLHRVVHSEHMISYYEEEAQDIERVLTIFIRLNSGGTVLSYSDLLLSIAVAQWSKLDARSEIHSLVDEINSMGAGFSFSQDFVLKAGLMLTDIASVGFKVSNFTAENMALLEKNWPEVRKALRLAVQLIASFGFSAETLRAESALLPIAYYLYLTKRTPDFITHTRHAADREAIRDMLVRSLLKVSGIWGSGLDTLLTGLRTTLKEHLAGPFPTRELRATFHGRGKSLAFEPSEIEDLLDMEYRDKRMFPLLSILFPFVDLRNQFHLDHIFPISRFTPGRLERAGITDKAVAEDLMNRANTLANIQLLEGPMNNEKRAAMPANWLSRNLDAEGSQHYRDKHLLGDVPSELTCFRAFHEQRRAAIRKRLTEILIERDPATPIAQAAQ